MTEKQTPRQFPAANEISQDALDRLLEALSSVVMSVNTLGKKVEDAARESKLQRFVVESTHDDVKVVTRDIEEFDRRLGTAERNINRHDAGFRSTSDVDAKHESELANIVIALDETRKLAKKAALEIEELRKSTGVVVAQGKTAVTALEKVDTDTKKARAPVAAAAALNLAIGIVYLILKLLEHHR